LLGAAASCIEINDLTSNDVIGRATHQRNLSRYHKNKQVDIKQEKIKGIYIVNDKGSFDR